MYKLTLAAFIRRVKLAFCSLHQHLKYLYSKNPNSILRDIELGDNLISEGTDDDAHSEGMTKVDRAVHDYISSLDKMFAVQYHQPHFRNLMNDWIRGVYVYAHFSPLIKRVLLHH